MKSVSTQLTQLLRTVKKNGPKKGRSDDPVIAEIVVDRLIHP